MVGRPLTLDLTSYFTTDAEAFSSAGSVVADECGLIIATGLSRVTRGEALALEE